MKQEDSNKQIPLQRAQTLNNKQKSQIVWEKIDYQNENKEKQDFQNRKSSIEKELQQVKENQKKIEAKKVILEKKQFQFLDFDINELQCELKNLKLGSKNNAKIINMQHQNQKEDHIQTDSNKKNKKKDDHILDIIKVAQKEKLLEEQHGENKQQEIFKQQKSKLISLLQDEDDEDK